MTTQAGLARRSLGTLGLWFYGVSASAPTTVLVAGIGVTFAATGVVGTPFSFLPLAVGLWWLSTGYVAVNRRLGHTAPFIAVPAHGLGRGWGVAGGLVAWLAYTVLQVGLYAYVGQAIVDTVGGGLWWTWAAAVWVLITTLGVRRVDLGAGILATLLVAEFVVIVILIVTAFTHPAPGGFTTDAVVPNRQFLAGAGGVLAFGIAAFIGWETPGAYAEEARDDRAPRWATNAALAVLGPLYFLAGLALVVAIGPDRIHDAAAADPTGLPFTILTDHLGVYGVMLSWYGKGLLLTSLGAAILSLSNTSGRYLFAAARERLLSARLHTTGGVEAQSQRDAPITASLTHSAVVGVLLLACAVSRLDPVLTIFTWLSAWAAYAILALLVATSIAAVRYFRRGRGGAEKAWTRKVAPVLGVVAGLGLLAVMTVQMDTLLGAGDSWLTTLAIPVTVAAAAGFGLLWAALVKALRPKVFAGIGDGRPHPLMVPDNRLKGLGLVK